MAKKRLGDRAEPQALQMPGEDDAIDARLTPTAGSNLSVTPGETTEWRRRRAQDSAMVRTALRWTRIGAIAAILGMVFAPVPSQKDQPLSRPASATSLPQKVPVATMPADPQSGSAAGSQDAQTVAAPPRKSLARNKAPHIHRSTGFDFVAPSPFGSDDNLGGTP